ncbi:hypothetical protein [Parendozoicomonas haliclonae]|uniref:Uncharacterized protein n=1 Tax=Parendozoicomonas haliclonae TaxID=1960125 RepID=A0A1X7AK87_9GAMM|nr:hypothetical protein [Parendozoicomonas haliclonae]SMA43401.1 hypothetical protein EHSB41UT_01578 [Parendozoicomonas haliclonae]
MESSQSPSRFSAGYFSFASRYKGTWIPIENLTGSRLTRKTLACLEHGLVNERLRLTGMSDECAHRDAECRADLALMAVGLLKFDASRGMVRTSGFWGRLRHWQVEQARALVQLSPDELCQEALWRVDTLPMGLVEDVFERTLRGCPGEPAVMPVTLADFWNAGLFSAEQITSARMLECRSRTLEWVEKRCAQDPRVMLAYLRTLHTRLRDRDEAAAVQTLLRRVEEAVDFWKEGYQLGEEFFRLDSSIEGSLRSALQVMVQHLHEIQRDQDFPWQEVIAEKALGIVWQHDSDK